MSEAFRDLLARQMEFNRRFFADRGLGDVRALSPTDRIHWSKEFVLHVEGELHELLGETSWKMHRQSPDPVIRTNVLEEWIDCLKFLLGLANVWDFSAEEIEEEFERKTQVVEYRYGMEQRLRAIPPGSERVVAVDIDGVLSDYPAVFCEWVCQTVPEFSFERRGDVPFLSALRGELGARRYLELKDRYRESGAKREQRVRAGAKALLDGLRAEGLNVVLLSARPYWRFSRIYADTLEWLDANGLRHEAVLFDREKHRRIVERFPGLLAMLEDDPVIAAEVVSAGVPVVLVENELNAGREVAGAHRAADPARALEAVLRIARERRTR
jgi:phosphoglycolate phosphatase-like HAD superfamily hydrolase